MNKWVCKWPRLSGIISIAYFFIMVILSVWVKHRLEQALPNEYMVLRHHWFWIIGISYVVWLALLVFCAFLLPRSISDFGMHLRGDAEVRRSLEAGKARLQSTAINTTVENEADDVMHTYSTRSVMLTPLITVGYILQIASIVLIGAMFSFVLANTTEPPAPTFARIKDRVCHTEMLSDTEIEKQQAPSQSLIAAMAKCDVDISESYVIGKSPSREGWFLKSTDSDRDDFFLRKSGKHLDLFRQESFVQHLYYSTITVFTIGFGDMYPLVDEARIATLFQCFGILVSIMFGLNFVVSFEINRHDKVLEAARAALGRV